MSSESVIIIALLVVTVILASSLTIMLIRLSASENECNRITDELEKLRKENERASEIDYSEKALKFIYTFINQIATMKYKEFMSKSELEMVTRAHLRPLIADVIKTASDSLADQGLKFDGLLFTHDYYEKYIIMTSQTIIRDMFEKTVEQE